jgi:hypothetical protein
VVPLRITGQALQEIVAQPDFAALNSSVDSGLIRGMRVIGYRSDINICN